MADWISWNADYSVKVPLIDEQHKELFRLFNEVGDALWDGKGKDKIQGALNFLADYTVEHFKAEEELMVRHGYPKYEFHKKVHDGFVQEVGSFVVRYKGEDVSSDLVVSVVNKLGDWVRNHVMEMDQEVGKYLQSRI
ncbi:MAG: bacteriohemerythrin [Pseudomonadota bacterium]